MAKWWEIEMAIKDAASNVDWARGAVADFYPDDAPEFKDPTLDSLLAKLDGLHEQFKGVITPEVQAMIDEEARSDDEAEARADAARL